MGCCPLHAKIYKLPQLHHPQIAEFLQKLPLEFTILRDHSSAAMRVWRVRGLPASFVIGMDGRIRYAHTGEMNWDDEKLINTLAGLLR